MKKLTKEEFISRSNKIHKNKYCYDKVKYINNQTKVTIICPLHGEFEQRPCGHLSGKTGCKKCKVNNTKNSKLKRYGDENYNNQEKMKNTNLKRYGKKYLMGTKEFVDQTKNSKLKRYGDENYNNQEKVKNTNLKRYGVDNIFKNSEFIQNNKLRIKERYANKNFVNKLKCKNKIEICKKIQDYIGDNYEILEYIDYYNIHIKNLITNDDCITSFYRIKHRFDLGLNICKKMSGTSKMEKELYQFIYEIYDGKILDNNRTIIPPLELDIYLPELKLAFEFNGLYWHNELNKDKDYHLNKTKRCYDNGIHLIQIYEDDWLYKKGIVKSRIKNFIGKSKRIYGRKTIIKELEPKECAQFLNENHIQGNVNSKYKYGLFHNGELVSVMTFGKSRFKDDNMEMHRFCNKLGYQVIGGASKLFKHFIRQHNPKSIISYADRSWSKGDLYKKLGFKLIFETKPNYYYIIDDIRINRFNFRKSNLIKEGFDKNKSEHQIMFDRDIYRIYDSGSLKFLYD